MVRHSWIARSLAHRMEFIAMLQFALEFSAISYMQHFKSLIDEDLENVSMTAI